jgi:hypothetical protein
VSSAGCASASNRSPGIPTYPAPNMIAEGDLVMTEHTERWEFHTGETIDHSFVSVTQLR